MNEQRFIGLIGLGYWGKNILRNLYELGVLKTACDFNKDIIEQRRKDFLDVNYTQSLEDILEDPEIKGVAIATPAVTHYEIAKKALLSGKDVFVEKPLSLKISEAEELIKIAEEKKQILMVGHILQYHPAVLKLKELINNKKLGEIEYIYSNRLNIGKIRTEENVLWSLAPHDISVILMLLGEEPLKVYAFGGAYVTSGIHDVAIVTLDFKDAKKAHIFISWINPYKEQRLVVIGSKAMAVFDDVSKEKLFLYPHKIAWENGIPNTYRAEATVIPIESGEPLKLELSHFVECILERKRPKTDGYEGLRVLKVLEKADEFLRENSSEIVRSVQNNVR